MPLTEDKDKLYHNPFKELGVSVAVGDGDVEVKEKIKQRYSYHSGLYSDEKNLSDEEKEQYPKQCLCFSLPDEDCINDIICGSRVVFEKNDEGEWLIHACVVQPSYTKLKLKQHEEVEFLEGLLISISPELLKMRTPNRAIRLEKCKAPDQQEQLNTIMKCRNICTLDSFKEKPLERGSNKQTVSSDARRDLYPDQYFCLSPLSSISLQGIQMGRLILFEKVSPENWLIHACVKGPAYAYSELTSDEQKFLESLVPDESRLTQYELNPTSEQQKILDMIMRDRGVCTRGELYSRLFERASTRFEKVEASYHLLMDDPLTFTLYRQIEAVYQAALTHQQNNVEKQGKLLDAKVLLLTHIEDFKKFSDKLPENVRSQGCVETVNILYAFLEYLVVNVKTYEKENLSIQLSRLIQAIFHTQKELQLPRGSSVAFMDSVELSFCLFLLAMLYDDGFLAQFVHGRLEMRKETFSSLKQLTVWQKNVIEVHFEDKHPLPNIIIIFHILLVKLASVPQKSLSYLFEQWLQPLAERGNYISNLYRLIIQALTLETPPDLKRLSLQEEYEQHVKVVSSLKMNGLVQCLHKFTFKQRDFNQVFYRNQGRIREIGSNYTQLEHFPPVILIQLLLHEFIYLLRMRIAIYCTVSGPSLPRLLQKDILKIVERARKLETQLAAVSHLLSVLTLKQLLPELLSHATERDYSAEQFIIGVDEKEVCQFAGRLSDSYNETIKQQNIVGQGRVGSESMWLLSLVVDQSYQAICFLDPDTKCCAGNICQGILMDDQNVERPPLNLSYLGWLSMRIHIIILHLLILDRFCAEKQPDFPSITSKLQHYLMDMFQNAHPPPANTLSQRPTLILDPTAEKCFLRMQEELHSNARLYPQDNSRLPDFILRLEEIIHDYKYTDDKKIMRKLTRYQEDIKKAGEILEHIELEAYKSPYATWIQIIRQFSSSEREQFCKFFYHYNTNNGPPKTTQLTGLLDVLWKHPLVIIPSDTSPPKTVELKTLSQKHYQSLKAYLMLLLSLHEARDQNEASRLHANSLGREYQIQRYHTMCKKCEEWRQDTEKGYDKLSSSIEEFSKNCDTLHARVSHLTEEVGKYEPARVYQKQLHSLHTLRHSCDSMFYTMKELQGTLQEHEGKRVLIQTELSTFERFVYDMPIPSCILGSASKDSHSIEAIYSQGQKAAAAKRDVPDIKLAGLPTDVAIQQLRKKCSQAMECSAMLERTAYTFHKRFNILSTQVNNAIELKQKRYDDYDEAKSDFDRAYSNLKSVLNFYNTLYDNCQQYSTARELWEALKHQQEREWEKVPVRLGERDKHKCDDETLIVHKKNALDVSYKSIQTFLLSDNEESTTLLDKDDSIICRYQEITAGVCTCHTQRHKWSDNFNHNYRNHCDSLLKNAKKYLKDFLQTYNPKALQQYKDCTALMASFKEQYQVLQEEYDALKKLTNWSQTHGIAIPADTHALLKDIVDCIKNYQSVLDSVEILLKSEEARLAVYSAPQKSQAKSGTPPVSEVIEASLPKEQDVVADKQASEKQAVGKVPRSKKKRKRKKKKRATTDARATDTLHTVEEEPLTDDNSAAEEHSSVLSGKTTSVSISLDALFKLLDAAITEGLSVPNPTALPRLQKQFPNIANMLTKINALNDKILKTESQITILHLQVKNIEALMNTDLYKNYQVQGSDLFLQQLKENLDNTTQKIEPCKTVVNKASTEMSQMIATLTFTALNDVRQSYPQVVDQALLADVIQHIEHQHHDYNDLRLLFCSEKDTVLFELSAEEKISLMIQPASTVPQSILAQLYLAVQSQQKLNRSQYYLDNVQDLLRQAEQFLQTSVNRISPSEESPSEESPSEESPSETVLYRKQLTAILEMTLEAQQKTRELRHIWSPGNTRIWGHHLDKPTDGPTLEEVMGLCNKLSSSLNDLKTRFQNIDNLTTHVNNLHVEPLLQLLSDQIHKMTKMPNDIIYFSQPSSAAFFHVIPPPPVHVIPPPPVQVIPSPPVSCALNQSSLFFRTHPPPPPAFFPNIAPHTPPAFLPNRALHINM